MPLTLTALGLAAMLVSAVLPGCEDVLEACPPCGKIEDGDITIANEPRLDHSFLALQRIRTRVDRIREEFTDTLEALSVGMGLSENERGDLDTLANRIGLELKGRKVEIRPPECRMSREAAVAFQQRCEAHACPGQPTKKTTIYCAGLLRGECDARTEGGCFTADPDADCSDGCIGGCNDAPSCPEPNDGFCRESYNGICYSDTPYACDGACDGLCERSESANCVAPDWFIGHCTGASPGGTCLGNIYPIGCAESCPGCGDDTCEDCDGAVVCRETAKFVAWSTLQCDGAEIHIEKKELSTDDIDTDGSTDTGDTDTGDTGTTDDTDTDTTENSLSYNMMTQVLVEKYYRTILNDYIWLSLLVNGKAGEYDLTNLLTRNSAWSIDDGTFRYESDAPTDLHIDKTRLALPLENMKSHFHWFQKTALDSEAGYQITFGAYECVTDALEEAQSMLSKMVPTVEHPQDDGTVYYSADESCKSGDSPVCLYNLLNQLSKLLSPITG